LALVLRLPFPSHAGTAVISSLEECSSITVPGTTPRTAVVGGTTIVSPDVAVQINSLSAYLFCPNNDTQPLVGTVMTSLVLTLPQTDVSSGAGQHEIQASYSFDYADLIPGRVPYSNYLLQQRCNSFTPGIFDPIKGPYCSTIWGQSHNLSGRCSSC
jgi:hypothetical protein